VRFGVFLSYRQAADQPLVERLHDKLTRDGIDVFWDVRSLPFGQEYEKAYANALAQSAVFCPILSPSALERTAALAADSDADPLMFEWRLALELQATGRRPTHIFPIFLGALQPLQPLRGSVNAAEQQDEHGVNEARALLSHSSSGLKAADRPCSASSRERVPSITDGSTSRLLQRSGCGDTNQMYMFGSLFEFLGQQEFCNDALNSVEVKVGATLAAMGHGAPHAAGKAASVASTLNALKAFQGHEITGFAHDGAATIDVVENAVRAIQEAVREAFALAQRGEVESLGAAWLGWSAKGERAARPRSSTTSELQDVVQDVHDEQMRSVPVSARHSAEL